MNRLFREIWPARSLQSRAARTGAILLLLAFSAISQEGAILRFPGSNGYYGIVITHAVAAYSLIEDGILAAGRTGEFSGWWQESLKKIDDYVPPQTYLTLLRASRPFGLSVVYPPGYAVYLAGTFLVEGKYEYNTARSVQALLNIVGVPLLLLASGALLGRFPEGYAAAAFYAMFPFPAEMSRFPLPDAVMTFLSAAFLFTSIWATLRDRVGSYLLVGLVLGVAANFRTDFLAVGVVLTLAIWRARQRFNVPTLQRILAVALVSFAMIVPYGLLQRKATGRFQISTPALGTALWESLGERPNPHGAILSDGAVADWLAAEGLLMHTSKGESFLVRQWAAAVRRDPGWFLASVFERQLRVLQWLRGMIDPTHMAFHPRINEPPNLGAWRSRLAASIRVTPSQFRKQPGGGLFSYAAHRPADFLRLFIYLVSERLALILSPKSISDWGLYAPPLWHAIFAVLVIIFAVGFVFGVLRDRLGFLLATVPITYFLVFSVLHVEHRYLLPALPSIAFVGCWGIGLLLRGGGRPDPPGGTPPILAEPIGNRQRE